MKSSILSKLSAILAFAIVSFLSSPLSSFAADSATKKTKANTVAKPEASDAFMKFLLSKAEKYSDKAESAVSKAVDIAMEEAPALAKEFLAWRAWKHGLYFAAINLLLISGIFLTYKGVKSIQADEEVAPALIVPGVCLSLFGITFFAVEGMSNLLSLVQIHVAPRIYLIEQAVNLVK